MRSLAATSCAEVAFTCGSKVSDAASASACSLRRSRRRSCLAPPSWKSLLETSAESGGAPTRRRRTRASERLRMRGWKVSWSSLVMASSRRLSIASSLARCMS